MYLSQLQRCREKAKQTLITLIGAAQKAFNLVKMIIALLLDELEVEGECSILWVLSDGEIIIELDVCIIIFCLSGLFREYPVCLTE